MHKYLHERSGVVNVLLITRMVPVGRALYGLLLPSLMALGAYERRRGRGQSDAARTPHATDRPQDHAPAVPRLRRRQLRAHVAHGGDPRIYDLRKADLGGLDLADIDLTGVDLTSASLRKATLRHAHLANAVLNHADLSACDLTEADLHGASLLEADFTGADLRGTDLSGSRNAAMAHVRGARIDRHTQLPPSLDPRDGGAIRADR